MDEPIGMHRFIRRKQVPLIPPAPVHKPIEPMQVLANHTKQAMRICKEVLEEYQEHGHDAEWQKHLLPRLSNLEGYIHEIVTLMEEERQQRRWT